MSYTTKPVPTYISQALGDKIEGFTPSSNVEPISIRDVKPIVSYSWTKDATPTMLVPGDPPIWTRNPTRVPADKGMRYIHENSVRMGPDRCPLEAIFIATEAMDKQNDLLNHDFISDRNSLRKLLRWAHGQTNGTDFRIDITLAGETVLLVRVEEKDEERISGFWGFGAEYVKGATKWPKGCEKSSCHHRVISMNFGGLKIALRFELDARTDDSSDDIDSLTAGLASLNTRSKSSSTTKTNDDVSFIRGIKIQKTSNELAPQSSLLEIKTRVQHKEIDWNETYPQLFLSQTPYLYVAKHSKGVFGTVQKYPLHGIDLRPHAAKAERAFSKLKDVLEDIQDVVKSHGEGRELTLVCIAGNLALHERKKGSGKELPEEVLAWFK